MKKVKKVKKVKEYNVVIEVRGGVAYVTRKDKGVGLKIIDWDNTINSDEKCENCYLADKIV
jgi:hypothetical protein